MASLEDLGRRVKNKYPGAYSDISDRQLGLLVKQKYPGAYDDFKEPVPSFMDKLWQGEFVRPAQVAKRGILGGSADFYGMLANAADLLGKATNTEPGGLFREWEQQLAAKAEAIPEPETTVEKIYEGTASAVPAIAKYSLASKVGGGPTLGMAGAEALSAAKEPPLEIAKAAALGGGLGRTLGVIAPASRGTRMLGAGALFGGQAAGQGGDVSDVVAGAVTGAGLLAGGGRGTSFREARRGVEPLPARAEAPADVRGLTSVEQATRGLTPVERALLEFTPAERARRRTTPLPEAEAVPFLPRRQTEVPADVQGLPTVEQVSRGLTPPPAPTQLGIQRQQIGPPAAALPERLVGQQANTYRMTPLERALRERLGAQASLIPTSLLRRGNITKKQLLNLRPSGTTKAEWKRRVDSIVGKRKKPAEANWPKGIFLGSGLGQVQSFLERPPKPSQPLTAGQKEARAFHAEQEAARKAAKKTPFDHLADFKRSVKMKFVEDMEPIFEMVRRAQKGYGFNLPAEKDFNVSLDRMRRAYNISHRFLADKGMNEIALELDPMQTMELNQYLIARQAKEVSEQAVPKRRHAKLKTDIAALEQRTKAAEGTEQKTLAKELKKLQAQEKKARARLKEIPYEEARGTKLSDAEARDTRLVEDLKGFYEPYAQRVRGISQELLRYAEDTGLISKETAIDLRERYPLYVPLQRIFSEGELLTGKQGGKATAHQPGQHHVRPMKGTKKLRPAEDPMQSIIEAAERVFLEGERNKNAELLAWYRGLPGAENMIREIFPEGGHPKASTPTFQWIDKGKIRTFETTPEIAAAAKSLDTYQMGTAMHILGIPTRIAKTTTTGMNPAFGAANIVYDALLSGIQARISPRKQFLSKGSLRALKETIVPGEIDAELAREGGGFTSYDFYRGGTPAATYQTIRLQEAMRSLVKDTKSRELVGRDLAVIRQHIKDRPIRTIAELYRLIEDGAARSESMGRLRVYETTKQDLIARGMPEADARLHAVRESNNALPNYMRYGQWGKALNPIFMYFNASIQGQRAFVKAAAEHPGSTIPRLALQVGLPVAAATIWNLSDEERAKAYWDIEPWLLDNNLSVLWPNPSKDDRRQWDGIRLKIGPGPGAATAKIVRGMIEQIYRDDPDLFKELAQASAGFVSPVEPEINSIMSQLIPQPTKGAIQAEADWDFFRRKPKVGANLRRAPTELQAMPWTSGTARLIAKQFDVSPLGTEEFLKDTLGGGTSQILHYSDKILAGFGLLSKDAAIGGESTPTAIARRFTRLQGGRTEREQYEEQERIARERLNETSAQISDEVKKELSNLFIRFGASPQREGEPDEVYALRARIRGVEMDQAARYVMSLPGYQNASDEDKESELRKYLRKAQTYATQLIDEVQTPEDLENLERQYFPQTRQAPVSSMPWELPPA
jgi:hypothetical protein